MKAHPVVGLTLNYRDAARTERCVRSLLAEGAAHVVVWDNSADGGASAFALTQAMRGCAAMRIVVSDDNLGFAAGVNQGLAEIASRFPSVAVLLINNDAVLLPGALHSLSSALVAHPGAHIVCPSISHGGWIRGTVYYQRWTGLITDRKLPGSFAFPSGCCMLVNLPTSGTSLFDEDFFMYGEDIALGARFEYDPTAIHHVPDMLVLHEGSASSGMATRFYEARMSVAHLLLVRKLAGKRGAVPMLLVGRLLFLPLRAVARSLRYRSFVPLTALLDGWRIVRHAPCRVPSSVRSHETVSRL